MAASLHETSHNDQDIDPNSTLVIRICIKTIAQARAQALFPTLDSERNDGVATPPNKLLAGHDTSRGKAKTMSGDMTKDRVMSMSPDELVALHKRVQQLELSNYGMLRRIYGDKISAGPYVQFNGQEAFASEAKSDTYRNRLFEHYQSMMAVARDPQIPGLEPASPEGARLLNTFLAEFARMTRTGDRPLTLKSPVNLARENKLRSPQKQSHGPWRVDKKAAQTQKARLEHFNTGARTHNTALTDYQIQLMLLEEQNQERLAMMKVRRQAAPLPTFDPVLYHAQLVALKLMNHKRLELESAWRADKMSEDIDTDADAGADTDYEMSNNSSPIIEPEESSRGRRRTVTLPARAKR